MDLNQILQGIGGVAGAMNPAYQEGAQEAMQQKQRKRYEVLMQSPMFQKAIQELYGENASLMQEAFQIMPMQQAGTFGKMIRPEQPEIPTTLDAALLAGYINPEQYQKFKAMGRAPNQINTPFEVWRINHPGGTAEDYWKDMERAKNPYYSFGEEFMAQRQAAIKECRARGWTLTTRNIDKAMKIVAKKNQEQSTKDEYGYSIGETTQKNDKTWEYIGNNQWQVK